MIYLYILEFPNTLPQPDLQQEPSLPPPLLTFICIILPFINCLFLHLRLHPPSWPFAGSPFHSFPPFLHSLHPSPPTACRTLTAGRVYHPLSGRGITSHGRLAGWPCAALPGIHTAARLIQLARLAVETSAILITKMMYFNPTNSIQQWKAAKTDVYVFVHTCVFVRVQKKCVCIFSISEQKHGWIQRMWAWATQSRNSKEDLKAKFGLLTGSCDLNACRWTLTQTQAHSHMCQWQARMWRFKACLSVVSPSEIWLYYLNWTQRGVNTGKPDGHCSQLCQWQPANDLYKQAEMIYILYLSVCLRWCVLYQGLGMCGSEVIFSRSYVYGY